jgi:phosphoglycolate phosphatase
MIDAVMFDIDGTLWNATPASADGWNAGLAGLGIAARVDAAQIAAVAGSPFEICVETLLPGLAARHPELLAMLGDHERLSVGRAGGEFYDGALSGVAELARTVDVFLVSNCQDWYMDLFLGFSGLAPVVRDVDCHGRSGLTKGEMVAYLRRRHSFAAPVYVGDTAGDQAAAGAAGVDYVHAAWGFGEADGAAVSAASFAELLALVARCAGRSTETS